AVVELACPARAYCRDGARHRGNRLRLPRTFAPRLMNGAHRCDGNRTSESEAPSGQRRCGTTRFVVLWWVAHIRIYWARSLLFEPGAIAFRSGAVGDGRPFHRCDQLSLLSSHGKKGERWACRVAAENVYQHSHWACSHGWQFRFYGMVKPCSRSWRSLSCPSSVQPSVNQRSSKHDIALCLRDFFCARDPVGVAISTRGFFRHAR